MAKVTARFVNKKSQILYEGRMDSYGILCSLYMSDSEDVPYEVTVEDGGKEMFHGTYWDAIKFLKD